MIVHDAEEYVEADDEDYEDVSIYSSDDEELSDDYSSIDPAHESYNDMLDKDDAVWHHRAAFYRMYVPMFRSVKTGTPLKTNKKYDMLVNLLWLLLHTVLLTQRGATKESIGLVAMWLTDACIGVT